MIAMPDVATSGSTTFEEILESRRSCRAFLQEPLDRSVIERILAMAQRTPSWCNAQPWKLIIASGSATEDFRQGLLEHVASFKPAPDIPFPREYQGVYLDRRRACGMQLYEAVGVARGDREGSGRQARENFRFFGAPHVAIVTSDAALGAYGTVDCGAFVTTFLLSAASLGVASIAQAALAFYSPFVRAHFDIPDERVVVCGISFGYADPAHAANSFRTSRAEIDEVVDWRG